MVYFLPGIILSAILGLICGSFINVIAYRLPREESIVKPRSRCPHCSHKLSYWELIPILGYIILQGRCRECGEKISPRYPLVEALTSLLFMLNFMWITGMREVLSGIFLIILFIPLALIDIDYKLLPDKLTLSGTALGVILSFLRPEITPFVSLAGILTGGGIFLLIAVITGGGIGGGDIKLLMLIGSFLGPLMVIINIFLAAILGVIVYLPGLIRGDKGLKSKLPFGPFLISAALILWFWGSELINFYWRLIISL